MRTFHADTSACMNGFENINRYIGFVISERVRHNLCMHTVQQQRQQQQQQNIAQTK